MALTQDEYGNWYDDGVNDIDTSFGGDWIPDDYLVSPEYSGDNIDAGGGWNPAGTGDSTSTGDSGDNIDAGGGWNPITGNSTTPSGGIGAELTKLLNSKMGTNFTGAQLAGLAGVLGGGVAGLAGLNKPSVVKGSMGYQGGIPKLTAARTMMTAPPATVDGKPYRPGSGGINYGGDVVYSPKGTTAVAPGGSYAPSEGISNLVRDVRSEERRVGKEC
jgi:hypothetical protein